MYVEHYLSFLAMLAAAKEPSLATRSWTSKLLGFLSAGGLLLYSTLLQVFSCYRCFLPQAFYQCRYILAAGILWLR